MKKIMTAFLALVTLVLTLMAPAAASTPYVTHTYSINGTIMESPDAYVPDVTVDSEYMGLPEGEGLSDVRDIEIDDDMNVYIVEGGMNRLIVLDRYYRVKAVVDEFVNEHGVPDSFRNPAGVFVAAGKVYVCDTTNSRIVIFDTDLNYLRTVQAPKSNLFEEDDIFSPVAVAVDSYGRMFVISSTTYQGIIVMDEEENFYGFIGAQAATVSALELLWRKFMTAEQIAAEEQIVSTEYNKIEIDDSDFVYASISSIDEGTLAGVISGRDKSSTYAPVKKFNANGTDVMNRNGFFPPAGEVKLDGKLGPSKIIDTAVGPNGTWSLIDEKRSKIFTYNNNGELLFAFGDNTGSQSGNVKSIQAISYQGDKMVVLDKGNNCLVVYRRTEYGDILMKAIVDQDNMNFEAAFGNWEQIIKRNNNFDIAYIGIGKYYNWNGEYETAMKYFRAAHDSALYSDAFNEIRNAWLNEWFWIIPVVVAVFLVVLVFLLGRAARINERASLRPGRKSLKEELVYIFHLIFHPFDGFWDLKHEKRGSVRSALIIVAFTIVAFYYQSVGTGYIFSGTDNINGTIFSAAFSVLVPVLLWVVSNWCLTTLLEGEGSLKDVFVATSYSIAPLGFFVIITTLISNVAVASDANILGMVNSIAFAWVGLLLFFGTMITHGYSLVKNFGTVLLTIAAMAFLMFLAVLFSSLIGKIISFIAGIVVEINYRI